MLISINIPAVADLPHTKKKTLFISNEYIWQEIELKRSF